MGQVGQGQPVRVEERHVEEKLAGCGDEKDGCAHAEFRYVEVEGGPEAARDRINAAIHEYLMSRSSDGRQSTPVQYAKGLLQEYEKARAEGRGPADSRWTLSKTVRVLRDAGPVFSLECESWSFTGGAHPLAGKTYLNFDPATGEKLTLASVLNEGTIPKLRAIAEKHFRTERGVAADADLSEAGFHFPDDRFALNDNYGIGTDSLMFYYAPYEIAPYVYGPTEIRIPFSEFRELLQDRMR
jgi:hypothetical protein